MENASSDLHAKKAAEPIQGMLAGKCAEARTIDLKAVFGKGCSFTLDTFDPSVVSQAGIGASGVLTLDFGALSHSGIHIRATDAEG